MKKHLLALALLAAAAPLSYVQRAEACGGCFHPDSRNVTQVVGHRMAFVVTPEATTLYDQIEYAGDPEDFAWVLPTKGTVSVGLSSDILFNTLQDLTDVTVIEPPIMCPGPPCPPFTMTSVDSGTSTATGTSSGTGGVEIIAEEVVGPYETVQLSSTDPQALNDWLNDHGYLVAPDIQPIITDYVDEGFNFLAMRLAPGEDVQSMRPVRITTPGASLELPLRMVAAGTGASVGLTLWVLSEGRYEPSNFKSFVIEPADVVWDHVTDSSNYGELVQAGYKSHVLGAWHVVTSREYGHSALGIPILNAAEFAPAQSGYGGVNGAGALAEAQEDIEVLLGNIGSGDLVVTRLATELTRTGLGRDLKLAASSDQSQLPITFQAGQAVNTPCPRCPEGEGGAGGAGATGGTGVGPGGSSGAGAFGAGGPSPTPPNEWSGSGAGSPMGDSPLGASGGCSWSGVAQGPLGFASLAALLGLGVLRRRSRRTSDRSVD